MRLWLLALIACCSMYDLAFAGQNWNEWVAVVRAQALQDGIKPAVFDSAFSDIHEPSPQIKGLSHSQPEHRLTYSKYRDTRVDAYRIAIGKKE